VSKPKTKANGDFGSWLEANNEVKSQRGLQCGVCRLPPEIYGKVKEARAGGMTYSRIAHGLSECKIEIGDFTISRHFRDNHESKRVRIYG
jgi:hypothetical protein